MAILEIVQYPHPLLKKVLTPVKKVDDSIRQLIDDMIETMYHDRGMGLAANQVEQDLRIFVMDMSDDHSNPIAFINPEIVEARGEMDDSEGCLSFTGVYVKIKRPQYIKIKALDRNGKELIREFENYNARCIHHENDHLNGITFFDRLGPVARKLAEKKFEKRRKQRI